LPDLDELDTLGLGMLANTRSSAVMLGIDDDEAYKNVEKEYINLVTYLDSLKEIKGINIWDITTENSKIIIDIEGDEFRENWLKFYNSLMILEGKILSVPGPEGKPALNVILTNESITIATDDLGEDGDYSRAYTDIYIYEGTNDVTKEWTITTESSEEVIGKLEDNRFKVEKLTEGNDNGFVTFKAVKEGYSNLSKRMSMSKVKTGHSAMNQWIQLSTPVITRDINYRYTPSSIKVESKERIGKGDILDFKGIFRIY